jgi:lysophospholipase L1-like esterase
MKSAGNKKFYIISLALVVSFCAVVETTYRLTKGPVPDPNNNGDLFCIPDRILGYRFRPGAIAPQGKDVNCINNVGLRGDDIATPKRPNTYRILCVGDSSTNGVNVHNQETYPGILGAFLKHTKFNGNLNVEVVNAGVPGYLSDQHAYLLERKYFHLEPDLIVFMMGVTDVSVTLMPTETSDAIRGIRRDSRYLPSTLDDFLQKHSSAYYWGSKSLRDYLELKTLEKDEKKDLTKDIESELSIYKKNYQAMIDKCKEHGIAVLNVNFPWNFSARVGREDNYTPLKDEIKYFEFNLYWQAMPILAKANQDLANKNEIINVDIQPYVSRSKNRLVFFGSGDFSHPSIEGNFLIASKVYESIVNNILPDKVKATCDGIDLANEYLLGIPPRD